jgi:RNA polymerase sigma-70 factor (ECF subfamily)
LRWHRRTRPQHRHDRGETDLADLNAAQAAVDDAFRAEWGRVVAHLIRVTGDWDLAEECAQDAFAKALERWPRDGVPISPAGWLKSTARNRAIDRVRRASTGRAKLQEVAMSAFGDGDGEPNGEGRAESGISDDRLRLISRAAIRRCRSRPRSR